MRTTAIHRACVVALAAASSAAYAQQQPAAEPPKQQAPAAAPAAPVDVPQSITITANKREERLQSIPAAATVVQSQQLDQQNIVAVQDLSRAVPTLDSSAAGLSVRGFGGVSFSLSAESSVGILLDGVSLSGAGGFPPNLFDVERVEVLEGPQGTLFGKNATSGIINIVTKSPSTRKFEGLGRFDVQSRNGKSVQAAVNLPVNESLAFRLSGTVMRDAETMHNLPDDSWDGSRKTNARLRMLWRATQDVTVNLIADQSVSKLQGGAGWTVYKSTPGSALTTLLGACGVTVGPENTDSCVNTSGKGNKTSVGGFSGQVDWALGDYTLTSVTALRTVKNDAPSADLDSVNLPAPNYSQPEVKKYRNVSQEIRVASPDHDWGNYVAGMYYFKGKVDQEITGVFSDPGAILGFPAAFGARNVIEADITSSALFAQGTYKLNKALSVTLGARIGREEISANRTGAVAPGAVAPLNPATLVPVSGETTDTYASGRIGAQYEFTRDNMGYVTYSRGYKGPAVNDNATNANIPLVVRPEIPTMLEVGSKNSFLNGRVGLNVSAYATRIKDFQSNVYNPSALAFVFSNAPTAKTHGLSVNFYGRPSSALVINGGLAYTISKYGSGYFVQCAQNPAITCPNANGTRDATGEQIAGAPKLRATLAGEYKFALGGFNASVGGDIVHTSEKVLDPTDPDRNLPATTIAGARFGLRAASDNWGVSLYARNLFDRFNPTYRIGNLVAFATGDTGSYTQFVGPESRRLVGISFDAKF